MFDIFRNLFPTKLSNVALLLTIISVLLVYYRTEPSPADLFMALAAIVVLATILLRRDWRILGWIDVPLILYLGYVAIQAIITYQSADIRFALITLYLGISYFVVKFVLIQNGQRGFHWLFKAYLVASIFTSLLMLYQLVDVYSLGGNWDNLYFGRPNGWFKDANVAGPFLLPIVIYSLYQFLNSNDRRHLFLFVLMTVGVLLSFSRGAYLGLFCGVGLTLGLHCFWQWQQNRKQIWLSVRRGLLVLVCVVYAWGFLNIYPPFFHLTMERFGTLIKEYDTQGRAVSWQAGLQGAGNSPFGTGSGSYEKQSTQYQQKQGSQSAQSSPSAQTSSAADFNKISGTKIITEEGEEIILTPSAHNTYIRVLLENGVVGLGLLSMFWLWLAVKGVRIVLRQQLLPGWLRPYAITASIAFIVYLPMGTFIDTLHWRFLWLVAGMLSAVIYWVNPANRND